MAGLLVNDKNPGMNEDGSVNATPEEQAQYEKIVANGMELMHNEKAVPAIIKSLQAGNPIAGLGNTLAMLVMRLQDSAEQQGQKLNGDALFNAAGEQLMPMLIEMAEAKGIHDYSEEDMTAAFSLAADTYRVTRQQQGKLPEEEIAADMEGLIQADKAGNLDDILPGVSDLAQAAPQDGGAKRA